VGKNDKYEAAALVEALQTHTDLVVSMLCYFHQCCDVLMISHEKQQVFELAEQPAAGEQHS